MARGPLGSLVGRLTVFLVGFVVVATVAVVVREYGVGRERLVAETHDNLLVQATVAADRLESALAERARMVTLWARLETSQDLAFDDVDTRVSQSLSELTTALGDGSRAVAARDGRILSASDPELLGDSPPPLPAAVAAALGAATPGMTIRGEGEGDAVVASEDVISTLDGERVGRIVVWTPLDRFLTAALPLDLGRTELLGAGGTTVLIRGEDLTRADTDYLWARHAARTRAGDVVVATGRPMGEVTRALQATFRQLATLAGLFLVLVVPATVLVVRSATRSLGRLTRAARELDPRDPGPLAVASRWDPSEVRVLADSLAGMVARLREARTELARSESLAAVGMLTKSLAHEIRTPLSVLRAGTEMLARNVGSDPRDVEVTEMLQSEVARLARLVDDLLVFGRPAPPAPQPMELRQVVEGALRALRADAAEAGVDLRLEEGEPVPLQADPDQLRQVVVNLATNGMRACPDGGAVTVRVGSDDTRAVLEVADTGVGIPPDRLQEIWRPLVTTHRSGNGLGLPIVRQLVEAHGGDIEVRSAPGQGTRMRVVLPLRPEEVE